MANLTPHNSAEAGDFAKIVIMPGDPKRAELIVKKYLNDYKLVTDVRGIVGYTGFYKGKKVSVYQSFADAGEWKDRIFTGIIEQSGRDHIILSDPTTGNWYLLLMIYVDFIKFDEEINTVEQFYPSIG